LFRLDRVADIQVLEALADPPPIELHDLSEGLVRPAADDPEVILEVSPDGRWVVEYFVHDRAEELEDGGLRITLRTPDPAALRRLALRLGRDGRIVSPPDLAKEAAHTAAQALTAYSSEEEESCSVTGRISTGSGRS
jgi:proteasome accessory factor C